MQRIELVLVVLLAGSSPIPASAQEVGDKAKRTLRAVKVDAPPVLDGEVRDDPVWRTIPSTGGFTQTNPDEGRPASQKTEVRVVYTDEAVYFSFVCFDDDPDTIVVSDSRRDADLTESDSLQIILDTYLDGQNGFVFGTNPAGIEYDGQVSRIGDAGSTVSAAANGAGSGFNINWDGVWAVKTSTGAYGWSAEFMIPFKTLRYPNKDSQLWGINIQRNIRRRNENSFWAPLSRQYDIYRLSDAGLLRGLEIESQRNLKIMPYVLGEVSDVGGEGKETDADFGFDLKYSLTPALTLDLTYNTDFAQVEVDESQVVLDRFNIFFPEKRPFFLENAGLFTAGKPGQVELFFSRRIGLSDDGDVIPIKGGARLSGAVGKTNVGLMLMQTDSVADVAPKNLFGVARIHRDLPNRSSIGAIFVDREASGNHPEEEKYNRTFGLDGRWGIGEYASLAGFIAGTRSPDSGNDDLVFSAAGNFESPAWTAILEYTEVGEDFNPEVGFLERDAGYRKLHTRLLRRYRPGDNAWGIQELRPHFSYTSYWDLHGFKETAKLHVDNHFEWKSGYELHTGINFTTEGLLEPYEISEGIFVTPGTYRNSEAQLVGITNQGAWLSFKLTTIVGGFYSGDRVALEPSMRMRLGERFITELSWIRNDVELPEGDFVTEVGQLRLSWSFTPKISFQTLFQYNNVDDFWSTNLRFSWQRAANTGLYVVYNDVQGLDRYSGAQPNRSLVIKYTHLFDLF